MSGVMALEGLWLNNYANPADGLQLRLQPGWRPKTIRSGEVRKYGGRRRSVAAEDTWKDLDFTLRMVTVAQVDSLTARVGVEHWVRTSTGLRVIGIFWDLDPSMILPDTVGGGLAEVSLKIEQVSGSDTI